MALLKTLPTVFGIPVQYWRILAVEVNYRDQVMTVTLGGILDKAARQAGARDVVYERVVVEGKDFAGDLSRADIYARLKSLPMFADSVDD